MTIPLGNVDAGSTLYIPFHTFDSNGASITITGLATSDILIYKNGSTTQRSSTNGYTLLDTDGIDFDGLTGIHGFSIDLSDNSDAGFYAAGSSYWVVVSSITADTRTVSFVAATFRIVPVSANLTQILGTALTETAGQIAAAFKQFFDVASPTGTMKAITNVVTATNLTNAPTNGDLTAAMKASVHAEADTALSDYDVPTNAELATALGTADDATLAAIGALNNLSQANVRSAVGLATANLDTQLAALPTAAENATEVLNAATLSPIISNVKQINDTDLTGDGSTTPWGPA